jgi:hypothetical protein
MRTNKYREGVVYERSEVPQDFLPLRTVEAEDPSLRRHIASLCQRGEVRRYRCGKKMFVHKDDIEAVRTKWHERKHSSLPLDYSSKASSDSRKAGDSDDLLKAVTAFLGAISTNQMTLISAVERLAIAAEQIAKQPLARMDDVAICEPLGQWRDMNDEAR